MNARSSLNLNAPLITSVAALALLGITLATTLPPLLSAAFGGSTEGPEPSDTIAGLVQEHDELLTTYKERFIGRSAFFRPMPPPKPLPPPPKPQPKPDRDEPPPQPVRPTPPPPPATYQGPPVSVVLGDKVLFKGSSTREASMWVKLGEEVNGLKVLAINAPKSVRVAHLRGEYDVPVFNWDMPFFRDASEARMPIEGLIITGGSPAPIQDIPPQSRQRREAEARSFDAGSDLPIDDADIDAQQHALEEQGIDPYAAQDTEFQVGDDEFDPELDEELDEAEWDDEEWTDEFDDAESDTDADDEELIDEEEDPDAVEDPEDPEDPENPEENPEDPENPEQPKNPDEPEKESKGDQSANDDPQQPQKDGSARSPAAGNNEPTK